MKYVNCRMNKPTALYNGTIYTGYQVLTGKALLMRDGKVENIVDDTHIPQEYAGHDLHGASLCPGLIDLQIYGTGTDLYSADVTEACIARITANLLKQGCTSYYLTLATNTIALFKEAIAIFKGADRRVAMGIHLEGPFLNAQKRGAHPADLVLPIGVDVLDELFADAADVVKIMTIAPELADEATIAYLQKKDVLVSAGHSNASFSEAYASFEGGIPTATHLWNAMSSLHHRDLGLPGAVLNHPSACASIIVDGVHVDYETVKLSKKMMGERLFLITDAVASCSQGIYQHLLQTDHYVLPDGTLSGSALTLLQGIRNCVDHVGIPLDEAIRMATLYPARLMKVDDIGRLEKGCRANVTVFDVNFDVVQVFVDGEQVV